MRTFATLLSLVLLSASASAQKAVLLTPPPGPAPQIHGPTVYACGPKHPFLYRIPATGKRPMHVQRRGTAGRLDAG